jgi:hypothetical protein
MPLFSSDIKMGCPVHQIASVLLLGRVTAKQVENAWTTLFSQYIAFRAREKHTGGGDGDKDRKKAGALSNAALDSFGKSVYYKLIDEVYVSTFPFRKSVKAPCSAHNDEAVQREIEFSSARPFSGDEARENSNWAGEGGESGDDADSDESEGQLEGRIHPNRKPSGSSKPSAKRPVAMSSMTKAKNAKRHKTDVDANAEADIIIVKAFNVINEKAKRQNVIAEENLKLARAREAREQAEYQARQQDYAARQKESRARIEREMTETVERLLESPNPVMQRLGQKKLKELEKMLEDGDGNAAE